MPAKNPDKWPEWRRRLGWVAILLAVVILFGSIWFTPLGHPMPWALAPLLTMALVMVSAWLLEAYR